MNPRVFVENRDKHLASSSWGVWCNPTQLWSFPIVSSLLVFFWLLDRLVNSSDCVWAQNSITKQQPSLVFDCYWVRKLRFEGIFPLCHAHQTWCQWIGCRQGSIELWNRWCLPSSNMAYPWPTTISIPNYKTLGWREYISHWNTQQATNWNEIRPSIQPSMYLKNSQSPNRDGYRQIPQSTATSRAKRNKY